MYFGSNGGSFPLPQNNDRGTTSGSDSMAASMALAVAASSSGEDSTSNFLHAAAAVFPTLGNQMAGSAAAAKSMISTTTSKTGLLSDTMFHPDQIAAKQSTLKMMTCSMIFREVDTHSW